jgi:parallel beta-helix repeat protein
MGRNMAGTVIRRGLSSRRLTALLLALLTVLAGLFLADPLARASSLISRQPISILGNAGFTPANGVVGGNGTASNPYLIQGWSISSCCGYTRILIRNTTAHFVLREVALSFGGNAILANVTDGTVEDSQLWQPEAGGYYTGSLSIDSSKNVVVSNVGTNSIRVDESQNLTVTGSGSKYGTLSMSSSDNIVLYNNTLTETVWPGLSITNSTRVTVEKNSLSRVVLSETSQQLDSIIITPDNTADGQPILFYNNCSKLRLNSRQAGEIIVTNCTNVKITNLTIRRGLQASIELAFDKDIMLDNITGTQTIEVNSSTLVKILRSTGDITLTSSDQVSISRNTAEPYLPDVGGSGINMISAIGSADVSISGNFHYEFELAGSSNVTITGNTVRGGDSTGISILDSDHVRVSGNSISTDTELESFGSKFVTISNNQFLSGVYQVAFFDSCSNIAIENNQVYAASSDGAAGILVQHCTGVKISGNNMTCVLFCDPRYVTVDLLAISQSNNVVIANNNLTRSNMAVGVADSSAVVISSNNIESNKLGVYLNNTNGARVFHDNFIHNFVQALDTYSAGNIWDNGYPSGGNFWSNYNGTDPDMDGIGDTPYVFNRNQDNFPLMQPFIDPPASTDLSKLVQVTL